MKTVIFPLMRAPGFLLTAEIRPNRISLRVCAPRPPVARRENGSDDSHGPEKSTKSALRERSREIKRGRETDRPTDCTTTRFRRGDVTTLSFVFPRRYRSVQRVVRGPVSSRKIEFATACRPPGAVKSIIRARRRLIFRFIAVIACYGFRPTSN